jgi:hypothetical protein
VGIDQERERESHLALFPAGSHLTAICYALHACGQLPMYIGWVGLLFWSFNVECFLSTVASQSCIFWSYHQGLGSFGVEANTLPTFQTGKANLHWPINTYKDRLTKYSFKCKYFDLLSTHPICLWRFFYVQVFDSCSILIFDTWHPNALHAVTCGSQSSVSRVTILASHATLHGIHLIPEFWV